MYSNTVCKYIPRLSLQGHHRAYQILALRRWNIKVNILKSYETESHNNVHINTPNHPCHVGFSYPSAVRAHGPWGKSDGTQGPSVEQGAREALVSEKQGPVTV